MSLENRAVLPLTLSLSLVVLAVVVGAFAFGVFAGLPITLLLAAVVIGGLTPLVVLFASGRVFEGLSVIGGLAGAACGGVGIANDPTQNAAAAVMLIGGLVIPPGDRLRVGHETKSSAESHTAAPIEPTN